MPTDGVNKRRRRFLVATTAVVGAVGAGAPKVGNVMFRGFAASTVSSIPFFTSALNAPNLFSKSAIIDSASLTPKKAATTPPTTTGVLGLLNNASKLSCRLLAFTACSCPTGSINSSYNGRQTNPCAWRWTCRCHWGSARG